MSNLAIEFGRRLAQVELEKNAAPFGEAAARAYMTHATKHPVLTGLAGAGVAAGVGYGTNRLIKHIAKKDPALAATADERGIAAGADAAVGAFHAPAVMASHYFLNDMFKNYTPSEGLSSKDVIKNYLKHDAMHGAVRGMAAGSLLSTLPIIKGTLSPKWQPVSEKLDKHDLDEYERSITDLKYKPQYQDPQFEKRYLNDAPPGSGAGIAMPLIGGAVGAVAQPLIKYGPTAGRAFVAALKNHLKNRATKTGPLPFVNMGYKGFLP